MGVRADGRWGLRRHRSRYQKPCTLPPMWALRLAFARLRPINTATIVKTLVVVTVGLLFLLGDYALFARLFRALAEAESQTPIFALGLLRNLLSLVFLVASVILFSSAMTTSIGSYFADLDLDMYHVAPRSRLRVALARWAKTLTQSATVIFLFLVPLFVAFAQQYDKPLSFYPIVLVNLALLLTIPVSLASLVILLLVRWFPVQRVHQIVASIAVLVLTVAVLAFRMSRPERFFTAISTDDVTKVLRTIELPSMSLYPSTSLATLMTRTDALPLSPRIAITALVLFAVFVLVARSWYFTAFVRARESMAPVAIGAAPATRFFDRLLMHADPPVRALIAKEVRTLTRDVAQWSQAFIMVALLFMYLYNIRMLPLGGDARATLIAYVNLGMTGFVIAAVCLRFAYPSVSTEGKAFWILRTAPVSYRQFVLVKVLVYATPLTLFSLLLTAFGNFILDADGMVWAFTLIGASLLAITLASVGVGMGALSPNFNAENPLQVGLSLGGFAYMAVSLGYVLTMMILMARPVMGYFMHRILGVADQSVAVVTPIVIALTLSALLSVVSLKVAERRLTAVTETD
jgi:ABC-2 type transport system permease protein